MTSWGSTDAAGSRRGSAPVALARGKKKDPDLKKATVFRTRGKHEERAAIKLKRRLTIIQRKSEKVAKVNSFTPWENNLEKKSLARRQKITR